jgi:WD40 repeat protein
MEEKRELDTLPEKKEGLESLSLSPDGRWLASVTTEGWVMVEEYDCGNKILKRKLNGAVHGVALAPDSRHLATANGNGTVYILRLDSR